MTLFVSKRQNTNGIKNKNKNISINTTKFLQKKPREVTLKTTGAVLLKAFASQYSLNKAVHLTGKNYFETKIFTTN